MAEKEQFATIQIMELWNKIQTEQRKKEEAKAKAEQMNKAKEIRKEAEQC